MFERGEWEDALEGPDPDLARLAHTPAAYLKIEKLEPIIRSEIDRTMCRVDQADSSLEIDVDLGTVCAAAREIAVSELEIELISGEPLAALEMAQRIAAEIPAKLGVMSKVERGFTLADGKTSAPMKPEPVHLERSMTIAQGFETIVSACLRHFRINEPVLIGSRDVEALHQLRVAIRRLRSAMALFRPAVADPELEQIQDELRWLIAELGDARNLDVYLERDLTDEQRSFVEERRSDAYDRAISVLDSARSRRLMLGLLSWAATGRWHENAMSNRPLPDFVNGRIDHLWSKVVRSRSIERMDDLKRHRLRIEVKKLRYALEFVDALPCRRARRKRRFRKTLEKVQDSLGKLHDIVTARSIVTLNSWLVGPEAFSKGERRLVREADRRLARLRNTGPYWN